MMGVAVVALLGGTAMAGQEQEDVKGGIFGVPINVKVDDVAIGPGAAKMETDVTVEFQATPTGGKMVVDYYVQGLSTPHAWVPAFEVAPRTVPINTGSKFTTFKIKAHAEPTRAYVITIDVMALDGGEQKYATRRDSVVVLPAGAAVGKAESQRREVRGTAGVPINVKVSPNQIGEGAASMDAVVTVTSDSPGWILLDYNFIGSAPGSAIKGRSVHEVLETAPRLVEMTGPSITLPIRARAGLTAPYVIEVDVLGLDAAGQQRYVAATSLFTVIPAP